MIGKITNSEPKSIRVAVDRVFNDKELLLVKLVSDGVPRIEIAEMLDKSVRTVEAQLDKLKKEFDCRSIPHLVAFFLRKKLID